MCCVNNSGKEHGRNRNRDRVNGSDGMFASRPTEDERVRLEDLFRRRIFQSGGGGDEEGSKKWKICGRLAQDHYEQAALV
jgi:hypothetical protein